MCSVCEMFERVLKWNDRYHSSDHVSSLKVLNRLLRNLVFGGYTRNVSFEFHFVHMSPVRSDT